MSTPTHKKKQKGFSCQTKIFGPHVQTTSTETENIMIQKCLELENAEQNYSRKE